MSRKNWTQKGLADSINIATTDQSKGGSYSLKVEGDSANLPAGEFAAELWTNSIQDSPSEGFLRSQFDPNESGITFGMTFRYQDKDNFYFAGVIRRQPENNFYFSIGKVVNGTGSWEDEDQIAGQSWNQVSAVADDSWNDVEVVAWVDGNGDLRARFQGGGGGSQIGNDVVDQDPDLSGGGAIGIMNLNSYIDSENPSQGDGHGYWDETEPGYD